MANSASRIFQQIEATADYYPPFIYDKLTQYSRLTTVLDPASSGYIPLSQAQISGQNTKPFIIGVIPPTSNVTGAILDRAVALGAPGGTTAKGAPATGDVRTQVTTLARAYAGYSIGDSLFDEVTQGRAGAPLYSSCGDLANFLLYRMGNRDPKMVNRQVPQAGLTWTPSLNINKPTLRAKQTGAWVQPSADNPLPKPGDIFLIGEYSPTEHDKEHQEHIGIVLSVDGNKVTTADYGQRDASGNPSSSVNIRNYSDGKLDGPGFPPRAIQGWIDIEQVKRTAEADLSVGSGGGSSGVYSAIGGENPTTKWAKEGDRSANQAQKIIDKTSNTTLDTATLWASLQQAQRQMIAATQAALDTMANTPPLKLIVNPSSFKTSLEKIISDGSYGRDGPIIEHWGDNQDKIEGSGKVAGFYAIDSATGHGPGLTRVARNASESWRNLLSLYLIYKNNATVWFSPGSNPDLGLTSATLSVVGSVYIYYDNTLYVGSFDSFNISESATEPFSVSYDFSFTVRAMFLLDRPTQQTSAAQAQRMAIARNVPAQTAQPASTPAVNAPSPFNGIGRTDTGPLSGSVGDPLAGLDAATSEGHKLLGIPTQSTPPTQIRR